MNKKLYEYSYSLRKNHIKKILIFISIFIFTILLVNMILKFLIFPVRQMSISMAPDLENGSLILATPIKKGFKRGDIVLLSPQAKPQNGKFLLNCDYLVRFFTGQQFSILEKKEFPGTKQKFRRIVALPGDTIYMRDYVMYIKPAGEKHFLTEFELTQKSYNVNFMAAPAQWDNEIGVRGYFDEFTLGADEYFVLGDNRKSSEDSRLWGIITPEQIEAKAILCYFPFRKFRIF